MWNKSKKIISLVAAATFLGAAFTMTACDGGSYKGDKLDYTSSTTDGVSNGGFVVEFMANAEVWGEDLTAYAGFADAVFGNVEKIKKGIYLL